MKSFVMNLVGRTPVLLLFTAAFVTLVAMSWLKAVPPVSAQSQLSPTVAIDSTPDIPVTITELRVVQNGVQPAHLEYKVKNESSERLLSVEITWHFSFSKAKGSVIRTRLDYFFDDPSRMNPGASDRNKTGLPFLKSKDNSDGETPIGVVGQITFAEFANHTRLGTDRDKMAAWLAGERNSRMDEYRQLAGILRAGGDAALHQALANPNAAVGDHAAGVRLELAGLESAKGIGAVKDTLTRRVSLQIPEP